MGDTKAVSPATRAATQAKRVTRKRQDPVSNPYVNQELNLNSSQAQVAFENGFMECDAALHSLSVVLPAVSRNADDVRVVLGAVEHSINEAFADIRREAERIKKIAEDNGIKIGAISYTHTKTYEARVTCNKSGQYLQIIRELDGLMGLTHAIWLAGFVDDNFRSEVERQWRRKTLRVSAEIKQISDRAFKAVFNKQNQKAQEQADNSAAADNALPPDDNAAASDEAEKPKKPRRSTKTKSEQKITAFNSTPELVDSALAAVF